MTRNKEIASIPKPALPVNAKTPYIFSYIFECVYIWTVHFLRYHVNEVSADCSLFQIESQNDRLNSTINWQTFAAHYEKMLMWRGIYFKFFTWS